LGAGGPGQPRLSGGRSLIIDALRRHGGNVTPAARKLGVSRDMLRDRMEKRASRRDHYP
jgi:DNA-binding NtrC family response regulator